MIYVIIGNAAMFLLQFSEVGNVYDTIYFSPVLVMNGEWWRLLTFIFMPPSSSPIFLVIALYFYYWVGSSLENQWGRMKFTIFYASGAVFIVIYSFVSVFLLRTLNQLPLEALTGFGTDNTYLNLSLFLAFATLFPDMQIRLFFLIPVKVKWVALVTVGFFVLGMLSPPLSLLSLTPLIALGNYLLFFGGTLFKALKKGRHNSKRTVRFKAEIRETRRERGYVHKCSVCGLTDADSGDMEFRYCSLCSGYQCYCSHHIFSHEHKKG